MAKETPSQRREVSPLDQPVQSSDRKYYASKQGPSAIARTIADSTLKDPNAVVANPTPRIVDPRVRQQADLPRSADQYYANDTRAQGRPVPPLNSQQAGPGTTIRAGAIEEVYIDSEADIAKRMGQAVDMIRGGAYQVRVGLVDRAWARKARQAVEFAITREQITEDQGRDIVFGVVPANAVPKLQASASVPADPVATDLADPTKFISDEPAPEPAADAMKPPEKPSVAVDEPAEESSQEEAPVEVAADEPSPTEEQPPAPSPEDADDSD